MEATETKSWSRLVNIDNLTRPRLYIQNVTDKNDESLMSLYLIPVCSWMKHHFFLQIFFKLFFSCFAALPHILNHLKKQLFFMNKKKINELVWVSGWGCLSGCQQQSLKRQRRDSPLLLSCYYSVCCILNSLNKKFPAVLPETKTRPSTNAFESETRLSWSGLKSRNDLQSDRLVKVWLTLRNLLCDAADLWLWVSCPLPLTGPTHLNGGRCSLQSQCCNLFICAAQPPSAGELISIGTLCNAVA